MKTYLSFFESGRAMLSQPGKKILIFKSGAGITKSIESAGFDVEEVQAAMNKACTLNDAISWESALAEVPVPVVDDNDKLLFTDRGNRVTFDRVRVSDDDIRIALVHADHKFGQPLTLTGDDPIFTARMARLADDMGMRILNPELQVVIAEHRKTKNSSKI